MIKVERFTTHQNIQAIFDNALLKGGHFQGSYNLYKAREESHTLLL